MGRIQKNDNFIDKTFTIVADILLKVFPASKQEKQAFFYYREGMSAQSEGEYAEALENYYEALQIEEDPYDRSYILYNIVFDILLLLIYILYHKEFYNYK